MSTDPNAQQEPITFDVPQDVLDAVRRVAGSRQVRLSGEVRSGRLVIDNITFAEKGQPYPTSTFVAVNAPFKLALAASA